MTCQVYTARYSIKDADRLDITRAGCDRLIKAGKPAPGEVFAPSAGLVYPFLRAFKSATTEARRAELWTKYVKLYNAEQDAKEIDRAHEYALIALRPRVVLVCFCEDCERCHRSLAGPQLTKWGAEYKGEIGR